MIIETWVGICALVEFIIKDELEARKRRWFASKTLLEYLYLPTLDPIDEAMPLKYKLEHIQSGSTKEKEQILEMTQLAMEEMKCWVKKPLSSLIRIDLFLKEWKKIKKNKITSLICKAELHLENAQFKDIKDLMDSFSNWHSALGKP